MPVKKMELGEAKRKRKGSEKYSTSENVEGGYGFKDITSVLLQLFNRHLPPQFHQRRGQLPRTDSRRA